MMLTFNRVVGLLFALVLMTLSSGCQRSASSGESGSAHNAPTSAPIRFMEIAQQAGVHFTHYNGARGKKYMPETVGSGVAFLDYDNDGWQDILWINGTNWPGDKPVPDTMRLYHNNHDGSFTDVTQEAGLNVPMYGMGVAVGDFDNDGYEDIYITAVGANHLFRNRLGDPNRSGPIFQDVTRTAGVQGVSMTGTELRWKWSTSAAWFDYDRDGKLDLLVANYVKWSPMTDVFCGPDDKHKGYCPPGDYEGYYCTLYHNEGNGRFRDVSEETGIRGAHTLGKSFGIAVADFNGDGWPDVFVTNDTWPNFLWINQGGKRFAERAIESGVALSESGKPKAGMGIDVGDWNNTGKCSILIGNFPGDALSLFDPQQDMLFTDRAQVTGLATPSLLFLAFGLFFFDYDLDGWQDIITADGHIDDFIKTTNTLLDYRQRPLLFHNNAQGRFDEVGKACGLTQAVVGRGIAYADIDNDGDLDVALVDNGGRGLLYRNEGGNQNHWIRFRAEGTRSNRDGIGALIRLTCNGITQSQYVHSGGSYLSESQRQPTFGVAQAETVAHVEVLWPSGHRDKVDNLRVNQQYVMEEGRGFRKDSRGQAQSLLQSKYGLKSVDFRK